MRLVSSPRIAAAVFVLILGTGVPSSAHEILEGPAPFDVVRVARDSSRAVLFAPADRRAELLAPPDRSAGLFAPPDRRAGLLAPPDRRAGLLAPPQRRPELLAPPQPERRPGLLVPPRPKRPDSLVPLYISLAALNVLDVHSTRAAVAQGGVEFNPVLKPFAGSSAALLAVKAASTTGMIFAAEKIRKKNPAAAVAFMVAANSAMIWVVQHNYRAAR